MDPVTLKKEFEARRQLLMIDGSQLQPAIRDFGDPGGAEQAFRVILRDGDDVQNRNRDGLALALFQSTGMASRVGSSDMAGLEHVLAGHRLPEGHDDLNGIQAENGRLEVQIKTSRGWVNCATGQVQNPDAIALEDGVVSNFG